MNSEKQELYDCYGFRTKAAKLAIQNYLYDAEKDQQQIALWQNILQLEFEQQKQTIKIQVRKGIPDQLRPQVWMKLIKPPLKQYESIIVKYELKEIDRDVNRTLPTNKREKQLRQRLRRMLNVIAVAFPEMGYCQGLNFITANLLLILDDKQTYNVMYHILFWNGHEELMSDLDRIYIKLYTLNKLVKKHYPKLSKCLQKMEIDLMLYASSWFITLYSNTLPCQYIFRILEIYLVEGEKILYRVALQILREKKKFLKSMNSIQDVNEQMKNTDDFDIGKIDKFFRQMFEINLSRKQIEGYQNEYINSIKEKKKQSHQ